jgi:hypothetical protein
MWVAIQTRLLWVRVCWEWIFFPPQLHVGWLGECVKMGDFERNEWWGHFLQLGDFSDEV